MSGRLTEVDYWDRLWDGRPIPWPLDPNDHRLNNFINMEFHRFFKRVIGQIAPFNHKGMYFIEVGCGGSIILPYFYQAHGFQVAGLDYSPNGCDSSRAINAQARVPADIRQGDMFDPPSDMIGAFDIVFSSGLVEHFRPTTAAVEALARFCKPGGFMITIIPNLAGALGALQRFLNKPIYDLHVPLDQNNLVDAHRDCGLDIIDCGLIGTINLNVLNFGGGGSRLSPQIGQRLTSWISKAVWILLRGVPEIPNRWFSPYIACVARKQTSSGPIQTFATHFGGDLLRMFESKDHEPNISF